MKAIHLLSTRLMSATALTEAASKGVEISQHEFIVTEINKVARIEPQAAEAWIFTSRHAVEAVVNKVENPPKVYCISGATAEEFSLLMGKEKLQGIAPDAESLADVIIADSVRSAIFFCGDRRRNELPVKLQQHGISVSEQIVYHTKLLPHHVAGVFDAVAFFSPSAVDSFFESNEITPTTVCFAIGGTTAAQIEKYFSGQVIRAEGPSEQQLIDAVLNYYHS